jgi:hypothetical protein
MATILGLPGSWPMGQQSTAFVRRDQWTHLPAGGPPVAGYTSWWDATQIGVADGAALSAWNDLAGTNHLAQATGANQPTFVKSGANQINGHPCVRFNGTSHYMATAGPSISQPYSIFVIARPEGSAVSCAVGTVNYTAVLVQTPMTWEIYNSTNLDAPANSASVGRADMVIAQFVGASSALTVNGAATVTGPIGTVAANGAIVGANSSSAAPPLAPSTYWLGGIGEILLYPSLLSPAQISSLHGYAQSKWGTP